MVVIKVRERMMSEVERDRISGIWDGGVYIIFGRGLV